MNGADTHRVKSGNHAIIWSHALNKTLSARPAFGDDHFIYRTPRWVEATYLGLSLLIAGLLAYLALSISSNSLPLTVTLWLASGILVVIALRRRPEAASIYFACDQEGIYFPSSRAKSIVTRTKDVPWLHVPWHNISDIRIQLLLDEAANRKGVVFSVAATSTEEREFLARHSVFKNREAQKSGSIKGFLVGFSNFFHRQDDVMFHLGRFQTTTQAPRRQPIEMNLDRSVAKEV